MPKRDQMLRLMNISNILKSKKNGVTYKEVQNYLYKKHRDKDYENDLAFSEKTFKRDRNLLYELFGIEIKFSRKTMTYQIIDDEFSNNSQTIFDTLLLINAYRQTNDNSEVVLFEKRKASGLENLEELIFACKHSKIITLNYIKYWEEVSKKRVLEPYALKEFNSRWYLLAHDNNEKDFNIKIFGLDRISNLEVSNSSFQKNKINLALLFQNSFGIISTLDETPVEIILSFNALQGKYIKSLPLHSSQKILIDNEKELRIQLNLVPTFDFMQEVFSYGKEVEVISPKTFKNEYVAELKKMISKYF